jgi:AsmA protein
MRRFVVIVLVLLLLIVGGVAAAVFLVPTEVYKAKIEEQASTMLGRQVEIGGEVTLNFFPTITASAANVRIGNPEGFSGQDFAKMDEMKVGVELIPLFSKRVEITEFVLVRPQISLEKRRNNAVNWAIGSGASAKTRAKANKGFARAPGALPLEASLGNVRIVDGKATYTDKVNKTKTVLKAINLSLKLPDLDKQMNLSGDLIINDQAFELKAMLGSLRGFLEGAATPADFSAKSQLIQFTFNGEFVQSKDIEFAGRMDLKIPSLQKLAEANGKGFEAKPGTLQRFEVSGQVKGRTDRLKFSQASLKIDDISANGSFGAYFKGKTPKITGKLSVDMLDLTPYLPPQPPKGTAIPAWSQDSLSLDALKSVDANFTLKVSAMKVRNISFGQTDLTAKLVGGRLEANLTETRLYQGTGTGRIVVNNRGGTPSFSLKMDIKDLQALPLFEAAAGFTRIDGVGELHLNLLGSGKSIDAMMRSLSGNSQLALRDGSIVGVDLANILRSAQNYLLNGALPSSLSGDKKKTDFSSLTGSFQIANGVARNTDMLMSGPAMRVKGNGQVDLGNQTLDYHLIPRAVASIEGQGGKTDLKGVSAPFRIHGSWNNVKAGIDTQALQRQLQGQLEDRAREEARKLIEDNVDGELGSVLQGLLGTPKPVNPPAEGTPEEKSDEEKALDVLGGFLGLGGSKDDDGGE